MKLKCKYFLYLGLLFFFITTSCSTRINEPIIFSDDIYDSDPVTSGTFFYGADLSYVNEMEDCGAVYRDQNNEVKDVYDIFKNEGTNLVRYRLWVDPSWTNYSTFTDAKKSIQRAKNAGFKVLLDFHYSDTWADPGNQEIPVAWASQINDTNALSQLLYNYTYNVLNELNGEGLLPDIVQVGNEINGNILTQGNPFPIDWSRNSALINKGIQAVRDVSNTFNANIEVMLHIAQPENGLWWFEQATQNGVTDYDWIGLSYYPEFSTYTLQNIEEPLSQLINTHNKKLMIVETAYPYTLDNADSANNILGSNSLVSGLPATEQGQLDFLNGLISKVKLAGGLGVIYWEPAWVSTGCNTLWATGSHWDNATLFDSNGQPTRAMKFYNESFNN